jgi:hypothetical protein
MHRRHGFLEVAINDHRHACRKCHDVQHSAKRPDRASAKLELTIIKRQQRRAANSLRRLRYRDEGVVAATSRIHRDHQSPARRRYGRKDCIQSLQPIHLDAARTPANPVTTVMYVASAVLLCERRGERACEELARRRTDAWC